MNGKSPKVILLTGPGGSGKSTVAELISNKFGFTLIDGDNLDTEFFPGGEQWAKYQLCNYILGFAYQQP